MNIPWSGSDDDYTWEIEQGESWRMKIKYRTQIDGFGSYSLWEIEADQIEFEYDGKGCTLKDLFDLIGHMEMRIKKLEDL